MFVVYILRSLKNSKRYIGYSGKTAEVRLLEHNSGTNKFTRLNKPFVLIYSELYKEKIEAIKREKFLKTGKGREFLDKLKI